MVRPSASSASLAVLAPPSVSAGPVATAHVSQREPLRRAQPVDDAARIAAAAAAIRVSAVGGVGHAQPIEDVPAAAPSRGVGEEAVTRQPCPRVRLSTRQPTAWRE